jgi:hypothetical protein
MTQTAVLEDLEFLETTVLPSDEQQTSQEPPKRRRGRPPGSKNRSTVEGDAVSTDGIGTQRRGRRPSNPVAILQREANALQAQLTAMLLLVGGATSMALPVTGTTILVRAEQGSAAIMEAAQANPRIAAALLRILHVSAYGPLVMWGAGIGTAVLLDFGILKPDTPPAQMMLGQDVLPKFQVVDTSPNGHAAGSQQPSSATENAHA